jgi:hypothetical protein
VPVSSRAGEDLPQAVHLDRLDLVLVKAAAESRFTVGLLAKTGQRNQATFVLAKTRTDTSCHLVAVKPGQPDIDQRNVWTLVKDQGKPLFAITRAADLETERVDKHTEGLTTIGIVLHDHDTDPSV